jgi:hypothetical protein
MSVDMAKAAIAALGIAAAAIAPAALAQDRKPSPIEAYDLAEQAYIYGFPMIAGYKAMYEFNIDTASSQYKAPFNELRSDARVFTYEDTAIVTPNSDTPYSFIQMDLRAEPIVLCVPRVERARYYSVQLTDMYTFNYGYIGSRATGNRAGCYMVSGPDWHGDTPDGISGVFHSETTFSQAIFRTQLFDPEDLENVKKVQAGYSAVRLSAFLHQPPPPPAPQITFPEFTGDAFKTDAFSFLNFLLQFCPTVPQEAALRASFARIGIVPGKPFDFASLPAEERLAIGLGLRQGYKDIATKRDSLGKPQNGWLIGSSFGDRQFYNGDYLLRAAAAAAGIYGNTAVEALYPLAVEDSNGHKLDGSAHAYKLTFPAGGLPPVNAFWSVTMYNEKQLLIKNPIDRYLINSAMFSDLVPNPDGSVSIDIRATSPGPGKERNWLPAPDGPIYMVMRLYWPKPDALDGGWKPPAVVPAD